MNNQFTKEEIQRLKIIANEDYIKLKQLICSHSDTYPYYEYGTNCSCCGQTNQKCSECGLVIEHECNDHDTEDGYCNSCR